MKRILRAGSVFVTPILFLSCSEDQPLFSTDPVPDEVRAIERVQIVHDGSGPFALRNGLSREVRVRGVDGNGRPIPGADAHLRLSIGSFHVARLSPLEDDMVDGERPFLLESRAPGRTELRASADRRGLTPLLADTVEVRVAFEGPQTGSIPGTYRYRGSLDRNGLTCFGAPQILLEETVAVEVSEDVVSTSLSFGTASGRYDPLEVTWVGLGEGRRSDGTPVQIRLSGVWTGSGELATPLAGPFFSDTLALSQTDESGAFVCRDVYLGTMRAVVD